MANLETIPADQFYIPIDLLDDTVSSTPEYTPPALKAGAYEVSVQPIFAQDFRPDAFRGAVRPLPANIGRLLYRTDTFDPLDTVGSQYEPVQNVDAYMTAWEAIIPVVPGHVLETAEITESVERNGGFFRCDINFPDYSCKVRQFDGSFAEVNLRVIIVNVHGQSSTRIIVGAVDQSCDNIMVFDEVTAPETRRTTGFNFEPLINTLRNDIRQFELHAKELNSWARKGIDEDAFQRVLKRNNFSANQIEKLVEKFHDEAEVRGYTLWAAWSALTAWSSHADEFYVRNSANVDNEAESLTKRMYKVSKVLGSPAFSAVLS